MSVKGKMKWVLWIGGGIAAVVLLAALSLLVIGHRPSAGRVRAATNIRATREQIWPWLCDGDKLKRWISWTVEVRGSGEGAGAKRVIVMSDMNNGATTMEVAGVFSEFAPPEHMTIQTAVPGAFDGE